MATFIDSDELLDNIQMAINNAEYYMLHETNLAPVVHAHWIVNEHGQPYCSNCNEVFLPYVLTEYCPHCGAIMDEKGEG